MRRTLAILFLLLAAQAPAPGQSRTPEAVRETVNEGASLYRAGRYGEAQEHFERALGDAPESGTIALFVARAIQQQYKPGQESAANRAKGEEAVAAYERVLRLAAGDQWLAEDAYKAVVFLHGQMRNEDKVREMLWWRAHDESAAAGKRAEALTILASKQWQCAYDITEQKENKEAGGQTAGGRLRIRYRMPANQADFDKARQCVTEGLKLAEQAVSLDEDNPNSWSYRANLLREAAKLAEMEGDRRRREEYDRLYTEALETHRRLTDEVDPPDPQR